MSVDTLIRAALDAGVELRFVDGKLKVTGKRKAVECWAPRLAASKTQLLEALSPPEPAAIDWRELDRVYLAHHFNCPTCIAAGRGRGLRCGTGSVLWAAYSAATEPKGNK